MVNCAISTTRKGFKASPSPTTATKDLLEEGLRAIRVIQANIVTQKHGEDTRRQAEEAILFLRRNCHIRNVLMALKPESTPIQLETVLAFHCADFQATEEEDAPPTAKRAKKSTNKSATRNASRNKLLLKRKQVLQSVFQDPVLRDHCQNQFPNLCYNKMIPHEQFFLGILGEGIDEASVTSGPTAISMAELFRRIRKAEDRLRSGHWDMRMRQELGRTWIPDMSQRDQVLIELEVEWGEYVATHLSRIGYVDVKAGVSIPGMSSVDSPSTNNGTCKSQQINCQGTSGGGIINWAGAFSPAFMDYFHETLSSMLFMKDPTMGTRARFIRCESPEATVKNPIYFQIGLPSKASLFQAVESTKFADQLLKICNYFEMERYRFFHLSLRAKFGSDLAAKFTPERQQYDLLFAVAAHKSFSFHADSNDFLFDDAKEGQEEKFLRVMTLFFQNSPMEIARLKFRSKVAAGPGDVVSQALGSSGLHEQGNFIQDRFLHCPEYSEAPVSFVRVAFTARATSHLQERGMLRLKSKQESIAIYGGSTGDYSVPLSSIFLPKQPSVTNESADMSWSGEEAGDDAVPLDHKLSDEDSPSDELSCSCSHVGSDAEVVVEHNDRIPDVCAADGSYTDETPPLPPLAQNQPLQRKDFRYRQRDANRGVRREIAETGETLPELLTSLNGHTAMMRKRIQLILEDEDGSPIPFGPCPSFRESGRFSRIGDHLHLDDVCQHYGIQYMAGQASPPWSWRLSGLNAIFLSKRYKSSLESTTAPGETTSPAEEVLTMLKQDQQCGRKEFFMYLSGGNASDDTNNRWVLDDDDMDTEVSPDLVTFRTNRIMTLLTNHRNLVLFEASCQSRVVTLFLLGQNVPEKLRYDHESRRAMCVHGGFYRLNPVEVCPPMSPTDISRLLRQTSEDYARVEGDKMTFLLSTHFRCKLTPVDGPAIDTQERNRKACQWMDLSMPYHSKKRLAFNVPNGFTLSQLFASGGLQKDALLDEYLNTRLGSSRTGMVVPAGKEGARLPVLVSTQATNKSVKDVDGLAFLLRRLLIAYSIRVCQANVMEDGTLSSLQDNPNGGKKTAYNSLMGDGMLRYCAILGSTIRRHGFPSPLLSGEANLVYLQECNVGSHCSYSAARASRNGMDYIRNNQEMVAALLIQSVITETTGNPPLNYLWSRSAPSSCDRPMLPHSLAMVTHYLDWMEFTIQNGACTIKDFLHGRYPIDAKFGDVETLRKILLQVASKSVMMVEKIISHRMSKPTMTRGETVQHFQGMLSSCTIVAWETFHVSRIVLAMEELISGNPFGCPDGEEVPRTPRSLLGRRYLKEDGMERGTGDTVKQLVLTGIRKDMCRSGAWYGYLFVDRDGNVCQVVNGRELSTLDVEHMLFLLGEYMGLECRRADSIPRWQANNTFPMVNMRFPKLEETARRGIVLFRELFSSRGVFYFQQKDNQATNAMESGRILSEYEEAHGRKGTPTVYVNDEVLKDALPKHEYTATTFVDMLAQKQFGIDGGCVRTHVLENASFGKTNEEVIPYADLETFHDGEGELPMVNEAKQKELSLASHGIKGSEFRHTFTVHAQTASQQRMKMVTAFYYHKDKVFTEGPVLILPIRAVWYFLVATNSPEDGCPDSKRDFKDWKLTLSNSEWKKVDAFEHNFRKYGAARGQNFLHFFKMYPGNAIAFDSTSWVHGSIIPAQEVARMILIGHRLVCS